MKIEEPTEFEQQFPPYFNYGHPMLPLPFPLAMMNPFLLAPYMLQMAPFHPMIPSFSNFPGLFMPPIDQRTKNIRKRKAKEVSSMMPDISPRPIWSFACLSLLAIINSPNNSVTTDDIYKFVLKNFPFFEGQNYASWTGAIRHNLTERKHLFERVAVSGRIGKWKIVSLDVAKSEIEKEIKQNSLSANTGFKNEADFATLVSAHLVKVKKEIED